MLTEFITNRTMEVQIYIERLAYFCILAFILTIIIYLYGWYKLNYWKRRGIQQLKNTNVIFGNFKNGILFRTPPGYHLGDIYRQVDSEAPYVGFYIFHKPCLLLKDTNTIKQIFIRDFHNFSNRHFAGLQQKDSFGMTNLFSINNPAWKYLRQKITPTLTRRKLKEMLPLMVDSASPMSSYVKNHLEKRNNSKLVDVQDLNYKYTADLIANIALGIKTDSFTYPDSDFTKYVMDYFRSFKRMVALLTVFFIPELVTIFGTVILFNSSFIRKIFWDSVASREIRGIKRGDFIDSIIQLKNGKQNPLYPFEGDNLLSQSETFFPGFESSSTAAAFTLMELAKHKQYQEKARQDIKNAFAKYGKTIEGFDNMKYLNQCIAESVRLHPAISTLDRYTLKDYKIPNTDICIEKGTPIFISLYGLHRDKRYFDDPDVFNPDRFSDGKVISDAYMPFGVGRRKCVGMKLGFLHVKIVIALILSEYEIYQKPEEQNKLNSKSTFTIAADGLNMKFTKLSDR